MGMSASEQPAARRVRADAQRSIDTLLKTAKAVFAARGVDAPMREIAEKAGVGVGTIYRHFPQRADLVAAVYRHEVDACESAARRFATDHPPADALVRWLYRYVDFIVTKRGLAEALRSGRNPAFESLPAYFYQKLGPALSALLKAANESGEISIDIEPNELLRVVANVCVPDERDKPGRGRRMVELLVDGMRFRASSRRVKKK
jgi:AcrR family transcriptional regulator